jgi:hypothetical protein
MKKVRKLYSSPNGDRWYLIGDASGEMFVRHEAHLASGGHVAHIMARTPGATTPDCDVDRP